jgi:hypothetical protein
MAPHQGLVQPHFADWHWSRTKLSGLLGPMLFDSELHNREKSAAKAKQPILLHRARPGGEARGQQSLRVLQDFMQHHVSPASNANGTLVEAKRELCLASFRGGLTDRNLWSPARHQ